MNLSELLIQCAQEEGFPLAGVVDLNFILGDSSEVFRNHVAHYDHWIQSGFHGSMEYLVRGRDRRANPRLLFPEAESILCVAIPYPRRSAGASLPEEGPRYARYLQGGDYHVSLTEKLEQVMQKVQLQWNPEQHGSSLQWKVCVDTSAVLERTWAALAGLGWIGKNTLLIHPKLGSYLFLGEVLINQKTGKAPSPLPNLCGHCERCLNACPTEAIGPPGTLNSNQCISYWTLEKRGEIAIPEKAKKQFGNWIAGCDLCQEICPFNQKPTKIELGLPIPPPLPSDASQIKTWKELLLESPEAYRARVKNSAMKRIKPAQFSRNLARSLFNALEKSTAMNWEELLPWVQHRCEIEQDPFAQTEWKQCLELFNIRKSNSVEGHGSKLGIDKS
jgi:epoxyqueuosine reductase